MTISSSASPSLEDSLLSLALAPPEHLINALIASDDHLNGQLSKFNGKSLAIIVRQPTVHLHLKFHSGGITLAPLKDSEAQTKTSTRIEGSLEDLLSLLAPPDSKPRPLANPAITLSGDISFIQDLHQAMQNLDIDWQDMLTPKSADALGDLIGSGITAFAESSRQFATAASESVQRNLKNYLTIETQTLVSRNELPPLVQRIESLTLRIDRATARSAILKHPVL